MFKYFIDYLVLIKNNNSEIADTNIIGAFYFKFVYNYRFSGDHISITHIIFSISEGIQMRCN